MSRLLVSFCLALILPSLLASQTPSPGGEPVQVVRISSANAASLGALLEAHHYDVLLISGDQNLVELAVSAAETAALQAAGLNPVVVESAQPLAQKLTGGLDIPVGYLDLAGIEASLLATAAAHPTIAQVVDLSTLTGVGPTSGGRTIKAIKISDNVAVDEDEPNLLIVAMHHAREIVTPEICLDHIARLVAGYGSDPVITSFVDDNEIWFIPVVNPDGFDHVWTVNNLWRKNRAPQAGGEIGVDLNRNYDLGWNSTCSGSTSPSSNTYKGTAPFSEIETRTIRDFSRDRRFAKVLDYHSSGREVLLGYFCSAMPATQDALISAEGTLLAAAAGYLTRDPSADGEHQEWQIKETTSYAYLVETQLSFQPPHADALAEAALTWPLMQAFLAREIPALGRVTDQVSGNPVEADVEVLGIGWQQGETRTAEGRFGRYQLFLPPGSHQVRFSSFGYADQTHSLVVPAMGQVLLDVMLVPLAPDTGQANRPLASLEFSGSVDWHGQPAGPQNGPFFASYAPGDPVIIDFEGPPLRPFFLLGAGLNRNNAVGTVGSLDIGFLGTTNDFSDINVVLNGIAPLSFFDQLSFLSPAGSRTFGLPAPALPGTNLGAFQAWIHQDQGLPLLSAATALTIQ